MLVTRRVPPLGQDATHDHNIVGQWRGADFEEVGAAHRQGERVAEGQGAHRRAAGGQGAVECHRAVDGAGPAESLRRAHCEAGGGRDIQGRAGAEDEVVLPAIEPAPIRVRVPALMVVLPVSVRRGKGQCAGAVLVQRASPGNHSRQVLQGAAAVGEDAIVGDLARISATARTSRSRQ